MTPVCRLILLALPLTLPASLAQAADLMMAGGHLPVCTSLATAECRDPVDWQDNALHETSFRIDREAIERWKEAASTRMQAGQLEVTARLLEAMRESHDTAIGAAEFRRQFRAQSIQINQQQVTGDQLYRRMSDPAWFMLRDHFQQPARAGDGTLKREQVLLHESINPHATRIFQRFVEIARKRNGGEQPLVLVSTASSRDPYDALAFYLQVFEQAGARTAWLPLDAAVRNARDADDCDNLAHYQAEMLGSFERQRIDPDSYARQVAFCKEAQSGLQLIEQASGVFFNGGDQWLTFQAFIGDGSEAAELAAIKRRMKAGKLILGGTSAGSAVQSQRVMVTSGGLSNSLLRGAFRRPPPDPGCDLDDSCPDGLKPQDMTWHEGGLATFPEGIVDTHFSERLRQFRLVRLLADTGAPFGIGIDETTAALVQLSRDDDPHSIETIGAGSSWIIDVSTALIDTRPGFRVSNAVLLEIPVGEQQTLDIASSDSRRVESIEDHENECIELAANASFHELTGELTDRSPDRCFRLDLGNGHSASGRLQQWEQSKDSIRVFLMDLAAEGESVVPATSPD